MLLPRPIDAKHKFQLLRLLQRILKHDFLSDKLMFKGGTFAALSGKLDRFSVDLDFDLPENDQKEEIREACHQLFQDLNLDIKDESQKHLQFFLRYEAPENTRNTLKLEINDDVSPFNTYQTTHLTEINMYCKAHDFPTMFANKLVAAKGRYDKNEKLAGRDFYDIHKFFMQNIPINKAVVEERTGQNINDYIQDLLELIESKLDENIIRNDLNTLLTLEQLHETEEFLKQELLTMLRGELNLV